MNQHALTAIEAWPITGGFTISRETKTDAVVVTAALTRNGVTGMGECVPLKRYGYTAESVRAEIDAWCAAQTDWSRDNLLATMKAGPARFALDTAMWHIEAQEQGVGFFDLAARGVTLDTVGTAFTLSGAAPDVMAARASHYADFRWLKIKLMGDGQDEERVKRIHAAAPLQDLIVDANEALTIEKLDRLLPIFAENRVTVIEQPLPAANDDALRYFKSPIPLVADESCHTADDLDDLNGKYAMVNIKLDKTGGLTHALQLAQQAKDMGFGLMIGCMASTSLSIEPAFILAQQSAVVDLDGALLLEKDRDNSKLCYRSGQISLI